MNCLSLRTVNIGSGIESIESYAFKDCHTDLTLNIDRESDEVQLGNKCFDAATIRYKSSTVVYETSTSLTYLSDPEGNGVVSCNTPDVKIVKIPDYFNGVKVVEIGKEAFSNCDSLTFVSIPDSVKKIGQSAFENCTSLSTLIIGSGIELIESKAFASCSDKTSIIIFAPQDSIIISPDSFPEGVIINFN